MKMIERLGEIFTDTDPRYIDPWNERVLGSFIKLKAIIIEEKKIKKETKIKTEKLNLKGIKGPQKELKAIARHLLKDSGYRIAAYERGFMGGIVDVLAKDKNGKTIAVECGPCRLTKAIDYLENPEAELWIVKKDRYFKIKRGINWRNIHTAYRKRLLETLKKTVKRAFSTFPE